MNKLSKDADSLSPEAKEKYKQTISLIGIDPFVLNTETYQRSTVSAAAVTVANALTTLPAVDGSDVVSYLVLQLYLILQTSFVTAKQFKAHKFMEAYNQFVCGWVKDVKAWNVRGKCVVTGKVSVLHQWMLHFYNVKLQILLFSTACRYGTPSVAAKLRLDAGSYSKFQEKYVVGTVPLWLASEKHAHTLQQFSSILKHWHG